MDPFSYIIVLTSIILGLGVTRLVGGLGHLLQTRKRRRPYWVHTLWMVNLLLSTAIIWWMTFRWRGTERWTFLLFLFLLLTPTLLYLISSLLFPDQEEETIADWQTYFFENNRVVFSLYALVFPIDILDTFLKGIEHARAQGPFYWITMTLWFALCLIGAATKNRGYHGMFAVFFLIYNLVFVGLTAITDQTAPGARFLP